MFEITCPSGLVIESAPLKGREIIAIAERVGATASGDTLCAFMGATCKRVVDPGPYTFAQPDQPGFPNWKRALWGDLLYAIIKLRVETFPEHRGNFDFEFSCPYCKALSEGSIDLAELIADTDHFQELPEASAKVLLANGLFETKTRAGKLVRFDLARVEQDEPMKVQMRRAKRSKETDVEQIAKRLKSVEGLTTSKGQPATDLASLWRWAQDLEADDIDALLHAMSSADIIVDSKILAWCRNPETECGRQCRIPLPLDIGFFRPRSGTRKAATAQDGDSPLSSPASTSNGGSVSNPISSGTRPKDQDSP